MKTTIELKAKHAKELADLELSEAIAAALADVPGGDLDKGQIYPHKDHVSVRLWANYGTSKTLSDAVKVVQHFADRIIEAEHWQSGCISCRPPEINSYAKEERATMDGAHAVAVEVKGGKGFGPDVAVTFWTRISDRLCEVSLPITGCLDLIPRVEGNYNQDGEFSGKVEWDWRQTQTADKFRKWYSQAPSYHGVYYLADVPNFLAWASSHGWKP